jgi:hypothetical protein
MMPVFSRVTGVLWISRKYKLRLTEKLRIATHVTLEGYQKTFLPVTAWSVAARQSD